MPDNETACANWIALREALLQGGYVQSTLTNFERGDVANGPRAFRYERLSFSPEATDALGFGPLSLSMFVDSAARRAVKLQRSKDLRHPPFTDGDLYFPLDEADLRLLFVTRSLAKGAFEQGAYQQLCGSAFERDFGPSSRLLVDEGLLQIEGARVALTPRGMFFSDAVVATFTAQADLRRGGAGIHTRDALDQKLTMPLHYGGMG